MSIARCATVRRAPVTAVCRLGAVGRAAILVLAMTVCAPSSRADEGRAWGVNNFGQLGDGTTANRTAPVLISGFSSGISGVAGGIHHSLGIHNGAAKAW